MFVMAPDERLAAPRRDSDRPWLFGQVTREERQSRRLRGRFLGLPARWLVCRVLLPQILVGAVVFAAARWTSYNLTGPFQISCVVFWAIALPAVALRSRLRRRVLHLAMICGFWALFGAASLGLEFQFSRIGSDLPDPTAARRRQPLPETKVAHPDRPATARQPLES